MATKQSGYTSKYVISKYKTTGVTLSRASVNGKHAGEFIEAKDCEKVLGESYVSLIENKPGNKKDK